MATLIGLSSQTLMLLLHELLQVGAGLHLSAIKLTFPQVQQQLLGLWLVLGQKVILKKFPCHIIAANLVWATSRLH